MKGCSEVQPMKNRAEQTTTVPLDELMCDLLANVDNFQYW